MVQILLIDDEEPIRKLLARIIELEGYKVSTASCCSDALQQLRKQQYDVILCDVFLPDGNGVDFIFDIKKILQWCCNNITDRTWKYSRWSTGY